MNALLGCLLLLLAPADSEVGVFTTDGQVVNGTLGSTELEMLTTFGSAVIDSDAVRSITFGDTDIVATTDDTTLKGTLDLDHLQITTADGVRSFRRPEIESLKASHHAELAPGEITDGVHWNGSTYHLRAPQSFAAGRTWPALVLLHGTHGNTEMYMRGIVAKWPEIGERYVLIGVNGTIVSEQATPDLPRYMYRFVNFAGRSTNPVQKGTERESPLLVAEVVRDLKARLPVGTTFVAGHSMGGYMTYSTFMNYPELFDGAIPVAGGMTPFCQPPGYADRKLRAVQSATPVAIVHATNDEVVLFSFAEEAQRLMHEAGFKQFKVFSNDTGGHRFLLLPFDQALAWLEEVTGIDGGA